MNCLYGAEIKTGVLLKNEPMKNHTSFKIGGEAEYLYIPTQINELIEVLKCLKQNGVAVTLIGNGSNLLVSDKGISGVVIKPGMNDITVSGNAIEAWCGCLLSKISNVALNNSLEGLEFASGIPGSLGGAVLMNAGAYGGEMKDVIDEVTVLTPELEIKTFKNKDCGFGYRRSIFEKNEAIILSAKLVLRHGNKNEIKNKMTELNKKRKEKQPLELPSGGSTFKRPEGYFAAKLIDDCGLRGRAYGGAMVSEKHTGFIVNYSNATCDDVLHLIEIVKREVKDKFGVELETEVKLIGNR